MRYKQRNYGAERSINGLYEGSGAEFPETPDWRLTAIQITGDLRERLNIDELQETQIIGNVDPDTLDWKFAPTED
ncbi:hypothetical protein [Halostagnicola larsenii]|nr:hypothetical protein [Halostagnicola larsenii]